MKYLKNKKILFWIAILLIATILRLFKLSQYPISLNVDEVSIGYDAFSILKTSKDHYGNFLPFVFKSLGDYKNGLYIYLTVISQFIFGFNEFSTRLTSAIFGILFIFLAFHLAKLLFTNKNIPYLVALLFTISPWHIRFSRGAYEANVALTLLYFGIYLFLKKISQNKSPLLGVLLMITSAYAYHSEKIIVPIIIIYLIIYNIRKLVPLKKILLQLTIIIAFLIPLFLSLISQDQSRNSSVLASQDPEITILAKNSLNFDNFDKKYLMSYFSIKRFFQYFDPSFLFINGLDLTQHINLNQGPFYLIEFPLFIIGFGFLVIKKDKLFKQKQYFYLFCLFIFVSIIPASITLNNYHLIRPYPTIFPFLCLISVGINQVITTPKRILILTFLYLLSIFIFLDYYFVHFTKQRDEWLFFPSKEVATTALENVNNYDQIIIDPSFGKLGPYYIGTPEMYLLFYGKIDPHVLWNKGKENNILNKIVYRHIEWNIDKKQKNSLLIGSPWSLPVENIPQNLLKKTIFYNDGSPAYLVVSTYEK